MEKNEKYSAFYKRYCEGLEKFAANKLERELSESERKSICNAGAVMWLEQIEMNIDYATNAQEVKKILDDYANGSERRFISDLQFLIESVEKLLNRKLSNVETERIQSLEYVKDLMEIGEQMNDAKENNREKTFEEILKQKCV